MKYVRRGGGGGGGWFFQVFPKKCLSLEDHRVKSPIAKWLLLKRLHGIFHFSFFFKGLHVRKVKSAQKNIQGSIHSSIPNTGGVDTLSRVRL